MRHHAIGLLLMAACGSSPGHSGAEVDAGVDAGANTGSDAGLHISCGNTTAVSFRTEVTPLVNHCGTELCHGGIGPSWTYPRLVNVLDSECSDGRRIVEPGNPTGSTVIQKLSGVNMCGGVRMPKTGPLFTDAQMKTLEDWICQGALDN